MLAASPGVVILLCCFLAVCRCCSVLLCVRLSAARLDVSEDEEGAELRPVHACSRTHPFRLHSHIHTHTLTLSKSAPVIHHFLISCLTKSPGLDWTSDAQVFKTFLTDLRPLTSTDSGPPRHTWSPPPLLLLLLRWLCVPTGTTNRTQMIDSACLVRWINKGRVGSPLWQLRVRVGVCVSFSTCSADQSRGKSSFHIISSCCVKSTTADTQISNA